jgi:hypothetical protein
MHKFLASLLVTLLTLPTSAFAQAVYSSQHNANVSLISAAFSGVTSPALSIKPSRTVAPRQTPAKAQNWVARHPALLGALIGIAAGGVAGGASGFCPATYSRGDKSDNCRSEGVGYGAAIGAGVGAGAGALIGKLF